MSWEKLTTSSAITDPNSHTHANKATLDKIGENAGTLLFNGTYVTHTHTNKTTLDKFGESGGLPTFNGVAIGGGSSGASLVVQQSSTFNLFNKALQANLTTSPQETHLIAVKEGYTYSWSTGTNATYTIYDANQTVLTTATSISVKVPTGGRFLSVKIYGGQSVLDNLMIIEGTYIYSSSDYIPFQQEIIPFKMPQGVFKSKWYGKTWWVLGDSISTGQGSGAPASMQPYSTAPYHYLLANERFIKVQNEAVSGYTIGNIYNNKVVNMPPTTYAPDLITIMAGTNDHGFQTTIGTIDDATSSTTFYGTYKKTVEFLLDRFPKAAIGLITPIQRYNATYDGKVARGGATLRGFSDAVINIAKYYSIPYLDLYDTVGFTPYRTTSLNNFYCLDGSNVPDGTHPNNLGHTFMKSRVGNFIESI